MNLVAADNLLTAVAHIRPGVLRQKAHPEEHRNNIIIVLNNQVVVVNGASKETVSVSKNGDYEWRNMDVKPTEDTVFQFSVVMSDKKTYSIELSSDDVYPANTWFNDNSEGGLDSLATYLGVKVDESKGVNISGLSVFLVASLVCGAVGEVTEGNIGSYGGLDFVLNIATILKNATNVVQGTKTLEGRELTANEFEFQIDEYTSNWAEIKTDGYSETIKNKADGIVMFSALSYSQAGTYYYTVKEVAPGTPESGMSYDTTVYRIKHVVEASSSTSGSGTTTQTFTVDQTVYKQVNGSWTEVDAITFANTYNPTTNYTFSKVWNGTPESSISVTLTDGTDSYGPIVVNAASGTSGGYDYAVTGYGTRNWSITVSGLPSGKTYSVASENTIGSYTVTNNKAVIDDANYWVSAISGNTITNTRYNVVENQGAGSLTINKSDAAGPLSGVSFTLNGVTKATDSDGKVTFTDIPVGTYELTETAPTGYIAAGSWTVIVSKVADTTADQTTNDDGSITLTYNHTASVAVTGETLQNGALSVLNVSQTRDVTVTKVWSDANNQDGKRPASIQVQLKANGVNSGAPITLNADNNWTYTWTGLAKMAAGEEIQYTVVESGVPTDYTSSTSGDMDTGFTITNSYAPEQTSVSVSKAWDDANNQDGIRPASVTVQLKANNVASGDPVTLSAANNWGHTWSGLNKMANGAEIIYTVAETSEHDGYEMASITGNAADGYTITNSHTPAVTSVSVTKVWNDAENQDGIRPASVQVQLKANGEPEGNPVTLSTTLTHTWNNLPVNENGEEIDYTVEEVAVPSGYTKAVTGSAENGYTITNTHVPAKTSVSVTKVWEDNNNEAGSRPASVTVQLKAGTVNSGAAVTLNADNQWTYTWTDLDVYANGAEIAYSVDETSVPTGYEKTSVTGDASTGYTITNTLKRDGFTVNKVDANGGAALEGAVFTLTNSVNGKTYTATSAANGEAAFENIPYGTYTLVETTAPANYVASGTIWSVVIDGNGVTITKQATAVQKLVSFFSAGSDDFVINGETLTVKNTHEVGTLTIEKDATPAGEISGSFTFTVYSDAAGTQVVDTITVTANGSASSAMTLDTGVYYVKETALADQTNYDLSGTTYTVNGTSVSAENGLIPVTVTANATAAVVCTNAYTIKTGNLVIGKSVSGIETDEVFEIVVTLGDGSGSAVSVAAGETKAYTANGMYTFALAHDETATITGIPYTTAYTVVENKSDDFSYVVTGEVSANDGLTINAPSTTKIVGNEYVTSGFVVEKEDENGNGLAGAEFTLYTDAACTAQYGTAVYTTDANGFVLIDNLPEGTYYLKETDAPANYLAGENPVWQIRVDAEQTNVTEVTVEEDTSSDNIFAKFVKTIITFFKGSHSSFSVAEQDVTFADGSQLKTAVLTVENTLIDYSLTISKSVTGAATNRSYKFNVYAATANGEKGELVAENVAVAAGSSVTLSNKPADGEISAPKLVAGTYIVEEVTSDVAVANYTWTGVTFDSSTAVLTETQRTASVAAENSYTRDMATLIVTKSFSGPEALDDEFQISVKEGTVDYATLTVATATGTGTAEDPYTWQISVKTNVAYNVSESNYDQVGDWSWTSGTVSGSATVTEKNGSKTVALNNVYAHDQAGLTITKDVTGVLSETNVGRTFEFKVYKAGDRTTEIATVTLPENGNWSKTISVDNNTSYEIVETDGAVSGYVWTVANKTVSADVPVTGSATAAFVNNYEKDFNDGNDVIIGDSFAISKTDGTNALAGVQFALTDGDTEIWNGTSDSNGAVTVVIENSDIVGAKAETGATKTYTLTETAPEGYVGAGPWTVTLTCSKAESQQQAESGKFYHIYTWTVTSVTDAKGEQLGENGITVVNNLIMGTITVNKLVNGLPEDVKNANEYTFSVYNANEDLVDTLTVNADSGWADTTISLPYGEYTIQESNPGNETGYTWSGVRFDQQTVSIASQGQQIEVTATNTYTRDLGDLTVSKTVKIDALAAAKVSGKTYELTIAGPADANGAYSIGGEETVTFEEGEATVTLTDGESITIENLPTGDYTVTEGDANVDGLNLAVTGSVNGGDAAVADNGLNVSVNKDAASTVAVTNTYTLGSDQNTARFTISKKNSDTNAAISGVVFTLYSDAQCTKPVAGMTKTTDDNGQAEFVLGDELLNGESATFYLKETVPAGYVDNGTKWQIEISKTDADGNYSVELSRIESGLFYKLYHWFVSIVNKNAVWTENTLVISNEPIDYTINVVKVDENGAALAGSAFSLNDTAMTAVSGTDNQFTATVNYTVTPQLTVSETTVPTGYTGVADFGLEFVVEEGVVTGLIETEDSESVTISKNGDVYTVTVENVRRPDGEDAIDDTAEFTISKVETGNSENGLAGAQFALLTEAEYEKYQAGEEYTALRTVTSDENGLVEITELVTVDDEAESTYYLIETAAPTGFTADNSVWTVTVVKTANDPVYEGSADEGQWIVHKSYAVTDIQLNGETVLNEGAVEISNTRNSYTVTVTKRFSGRAALPESFRIVNTYDGTVFTVANAASGDGIDTPYTWTMEIPFDTQVTFSEENYNDVAESGYSVETAIADNSGESTTDGAVIIPASSDTTVAFTNTYAKVFDEAGDEVNGDSFSISKTGDYEDGFLAGAQFTLTDENGVVVWTGTTTSEGVLDVVIEGIDVVNPKEISAEGESLRTYTLTEKAPAGYTGAGPWTVTISGKESISEDLKANKFYHIYDWTVKSVTLAGEAEDLLADGTISILNTRDYGTLTITKIVKGLVGAEAKAEHSFSINVANGSEISNTYDVTVTGNDTASYAETITLPTGAYSVKELEALIGEHSGPAVTWKVDDEAVEAEDGEIAIEIVKGAETAVEVTNEYSYDPAQHMVTVNVTKVWEDDNDRDGIRPDSIRVELKDAEGTVIGTQDIGASGVTTFEFDPYFNEYKKDYVVSEIGYTVDGEYTEGAVPGYTTEVDGYTVTNTHEVETINVSIEKVWRHKLYQTITIRLLANGVEVQAVELDGKVDDVETEAWKVCLEGLEKNAGGEAIDYMVTEDSLGGGWTYDLTEIAEENGDIRFVVKNYRTPGGSSEDEEEDEPIIDIPDIDVPTTDIPEEEVPAAQPPKTSDSMIVWVLAAAVSGLGLVWLALDGKKREEEEGI